MFPLCRLGGRRGARVDTGWMGKDDNIIIVVDTAPPVLQFLGCCLHGMDSELLYLCRGELLDMLVVAAIAPFVI